MVLGVYLANIVTKLHHRNCKAWIFTVAKVICKPRPIDKSVEVPYFIIKEGSAYRILTKLSQPKYTLVLLFWDETRFHRGKLKWPCEESACLLLPRNDNRRSRTAIFSVNGALKKLIEHTNHFYKKTHY